MKGIVKIDSFTLSEIFSNQPCLKLLKITSRIRFGLEYPFATNWFEIIWKIYKIPQIIALHSS